MLDRLQSMAESAFSTVSRKRDDIIADLHTNLDNRDMDAARENIKTLARLHPDNQQAWDAVCRIFKLERGVDPHQIIDIAEESITGVKSGTLLRNGLSRELRGVAGKYADSDPELAVRAAEVAADSAGNDGASRLLSICKFRELANRYVDSPIMAKDAVIYAYEYTQNDSRFNSAYLKNIVDYAEDIMRYIQDVAKNYQLPIAEFENKIGNHKTAIRDMANFVEHELEHEPDIRHELERNGRQIEQRLTRLLNDLETLPKPHAGGSEPRP